MYNPSLEQVMCHNKLPMRRTRKYCNKKLMPINLPIPRTIKRNSVDEHSCIFSNQNIIRSLRMITSPSKEQNCTLNRNSIDKHTQQIQGIASSVEIVINQLRSIKSPGEQYNCSYRIQKLKSIPKFEASNSMRFIKSVNIPNVSHLQSQRIISVNEQKLKWQRPIFVEQRGRRPQENLLILVTGDQMKLSSMKQQVVICDDSSDEEHNIWCKDDVNLVDSLLNLDSSMKQFLFLFKMRHESYPKQKTTISVTHLWYIIEAIAKKHNPVWIDELYT